MNDDELDRILKEVGHILIEVKSQNCLEQLCKTHENCLGLLLSQLRFTSLEHYL
jgi:chaperonin cofactor prefoldin